MATGTLHSQNGAQREVKQIQYKTVDELAEADAEKVWF